MTDLSILSKMNIAVVDDHDLIREGLNVVLLNHGVANVDKFGMATDLVASMRAGRTYDFYVVDLELPDWDGFKLIEAIKARHADAHIIVSTVHDEIWTLRKLLACKVNAIIYKSGMAGEDIITAMDEILAGRNYYCEAVHAILDAAGDNNLHPTARELEVLHLMAQGKTTREIAATLFVSDNTIEAHRRALFQKLGAINAVDLVVKAVEKGYIKKGGAIR